MRLGGIVSGMDTEWVVKELMELERKPIQRLEEEIQELEATKAEWQKLNQALQRFTEGLSELKDMDTYFAMEGRSNHEAISVSVSREARETSYDLEVHHLAQTHMIASGPMEHIEHPDDVEDFLDIQGELSFHIAGAEEPFTIEVEAEDSLADIRDKINNSELADLGEDQLDDRHLPLEASIIGDRLVIETTQTGVGHEITEIGGDETVWGEDGLDLWGEVNEEVNGEDNPMGFTNELRTAQNAKITLNGLEFERSTNVIDDLIEHAAIDISDLTVEDPEAPAATRITIERNTDGAKEAVENFVASFNEIYTELQDKGRVVIAGDDVETGPLQGDSLLRGLVRNLRTRVTDPINVQGLGLEREDSQLVLNELGIDVDRYGEMTFDSSQFEGVLAEEIDLVYEALGGERGVATRLEGYLEGMSYEEDARDGEKRGTTLGSRKFSLKNQIGRTEDRIERLSRRVDQREETLWSQFTRMEESLNKIYSERNWLSQQMWMMFM